MAGAREKFPGEEQLQTRRPVPATTAAATTRAKEETNAEFDVVLLVSRVIAVASLLTCLVLPIRVFVARPEVYADRFDLFKNVLIWPTLLYFVSGTIWAVKRDKAK